VNLNEGPASTDVIVNFTVYDEDGFSDLNDSSAMINFTRNGEALRQNLSCSREATFNNYYANYTCNVTMWWFDGAGTWNVTAAINDIGNLTGQNTSTSFIVNALTGFVEGPSALAWTTINAGATNQTSINDPIILNNTGNQDISAGSIQINATDLIGESNNSLAIYAGNFSASIFTGGNAECNSTATTMSRFVFAALLDASLFRGNYTLNNGTGQQSLYFCVKEAGSELTVQSYSTSSEGAWTVKILLVVFGAAGAGRRKKRKNSREDSGLVKALTVIKDELRERYSLERADALDSIINELREKEYLIKKTGYGSVPITIFSREVGALESVCKYMKENLGMTFHEIAVALNRNDRTVWTAFHKASEKAPKRAYAEKTEIYVPLNVLRDRKHTILEAVIIYLKAKNMRFSEIAELVDRDQRNVWTIYSRATKK
jgi:hypothetical protein